MFAQIENLLNWCLKMKQNLLFSQQIFSMMLVGGKLSFVLKWTFADTFYNFFAVIVDAGWLNTK